MKRTFLAIGLIALVLCVSAFGGCATNGTTNAQTSVFAVQQQYNHALAIGAWYGGLANCGTEGADKVFCSKPEVVTKIKQAKDVAGPAIAAAQATVRNPAFDGTTANQITLSASAALQVLTAITQPLEELLGKAISAGKAQPVTSASMTPLPMWDGKVDMAALDVVALLALLSKLLELIPVGTAWWSRVKADHDTLAAIKARGEANPGDPTAGQPTDDEWKALNAETHTLEAQIDANAAAHGNGG